MGSLFGGGGKEVSSSSSSSGGIGGYVTEEDETSSWSEHFSGRMEVLYANIPDETRTCIIENSLKLWKNKRNFGTSEDIVHDLEKKCATGWEHVQVLYKTMKADFYKLTKPMQDMIIEKYFSDSVPINAHYPPDNNEKLSSKLYYHKLGTDSKAEDVLVQISHKNSFRTPKKPVCLIDDLLLLTDLSYGYKLTEKESEKIGTSIIDQDGKIRLTKYVRIFGQELTAESEFQPVESIQIDGLTIEAS
uniref:Uncharacterized protein n=1 Tax=Ditylenchus dipsaci TaxID=166011 RepID=A0A915EAX7_9BILA